MHIIHDRILTRHVPKALVWGLAASAALAGSFLLTGSNPAAAAASGTYGLSAMSQMDRLSSLQPGVQAGGESSHERNTNGSTIGNGDWNNFLFTTGSGSNTEKVMLDQKGPGTVYRIWVTGFNPNTDWIKVYFDGETTPRINKMFKDVFSGTQSPFLSPLVADNNHSSGGFTSYLPLPYAKSIRITTNMSNYYNVGYHSYSQDTAVTTWNGNEDSSAVRDIWNNLGSDPKSDAGNTVASGTANLAANSTQTILDTTGPRSISAIKVSIPGVTPGQNVADNGRAHKGTSSFNMTLDPTNTGLTLKRRFDYGIGNQRAGVYIDNAYVGDWYNAGLDGTYHWRDSSFAIPSNFTAGKSSVNVTLKFVSSDNDWNEFYYWAYSKVNGNDVLTDSLNVADGPSESSHAYFVSTLTWTGTRQYFYPSADTTDVLNNTRIRISWDNEATPSIDAPLGSFFAIGQHGAYSATSLMAGMNASGQMYIYLPMPFQQRAVVQLVNNRSSATNGVTYEIRHKAFSGDFSKTGYLRTQFTTTSPAVSGKDIPMLDITGSGNLVGVVNSYSSNGGPSYLEGDERIYTDDSQSPAFYGTGTEDFFDGGWYFDDHGQFSRPQSSLAANGWLGANHITAASRFFLADAIPFNRHIVASIEHGPYDTTAVNAWTLAYYYQKPVNKLNLTDTVDVGSNSSENSHNYSITAQTFNGSRTYQYEGTADQTNLTDNGRAHKGTSQFDVTIGSTNNGVVLRRRFDQGIINQQADVYVGTPGGTLAKAGTWYVAGGNGSHRWRDSDFTIPPSFTNGKTKLRVKIQFVSSTNDWNEFRYQAYTITP